MCGIAGIAHLNGASAQRDHLQRMGLALLHRGPDGEGFWIKDSVGLVHLRLAIIDLETGDQPLFNEDGSIGVVFNGEIYNFQDLRHSLERLGHVFRTRSDTEVLVHAYEQWGSKMVFHLNGMFVFAIYDIPKQRLFLARDRLGVKPLYYYQNKDIFLFASEINSLVASGLIPREIDFKALELYLHYQYIPCPFSIYEGVKKLAPAESVELDVPTGNIRIKSYWDLPIHKEPDQSKSLEEWMENIETLIDDAVSIRLMSDVPFGAFLSGGTDSGLTVAMMARKLSAPVRTFSIGLEGEENDELFDARTVAERYKTQHEEHRVSPEGLTLLPKLCTHFGEPFADSSAVPTYYVSKIARSKVKMVLSGDGGDEMFGGYLTYHRLLKARRLDFVPKGVLKKLAGWAHSRRVETWLNFIGSNWVERHDRLMSHFSIEERRALLGQDRDYSGSEHLAQTHPSHWKDLLLNTQYLDVKSYLPDDVLVKVDRMSMANSLEVRSPLLDYRIADLAFSIPTRLKIPKPSKKGIQGKFILKEIASKYLGRAYVYKPKKGFGIPIEKWLREDVKGYLADHLLTSSSPVYDYVDRPFAVSMIQEHQSGYFNHSAKIWNLLMLDGWFRYVYGKDVYS